MANTIILPDLPYSSDALEPYISARTLGFHHGKHHNAYVNNLNKFIANSDLEGETLEGIIKKTANNNEKAGIFNNAAQVWNHTFFWNSMKPQGGGAPPSDLADKINNDFGSFEAFKEQFKTAALTQFGSGWAWLVLKDGKIEIMKTANADTPLAHGIKALLTVDVWEHSYYLDHQNDRGKYFDLFIENLVNWDFLISNME